MPNPYSNPDTGILVKYDNSCIGKQNFNMYTFVVRSKRKKDEEESQNCQTRTAIDDSGESSKTEASPTSNTSSCTQHYPPYPDIGSFSCIILCTKLKYRSPSCVYDIVNLLRNYLRIPVLYREAVY